MVLQSRLFCCKITAILYMAACKIPQITLDEGGTLMFQGASQLPSVAIVVAVFEWNPPLPDSLCSIRL